MAQFVKVAKMSELPERDGSLEEGPDREPVRRACPCPAMRIAQVRLSVPQRSAVGANEPGW